MVIIIEIITNEQFGQSSEKYLFCYLNKRIKIID